MGTNYYAIHKACDCCGRSDETIHLGKSSGGWPFLIQYNGGRYYTNWSEFKEWVKDKSIEDEYGKSLTPAELIGIIELDKDIADPDLADFGPDLRLIDGYRFYDCEFS